MFPKMLMMMTMTAYQMYLSCVHHTTHVYMGLATIADMQQQKGAHRMKLSLLLCHAALDKMCNNRKEREREREGRSIMMTLWWCYYWSMQRKASKVTYCDVDTIAETSISSFMITYNFSTLFLPPRWRFFTRNSSSLVVFWTACRISLEEKNNAYRREITFLLIFITPTWLHFFACLCFSLSDSLLELFLNLCMYEIQNQALLDHRKNREI